MMTFSPVERVRDRFPDAVLLAVAKGEKRPTLPGWQTIQREHMADPAYLDSLNHGGNVGVLLGEASGGLCALDFDAAADAETFLTLNPRLAGSFRSCGARGCQVWVRVQGDFPASGDAKDAGGRKACEWRANGRQSVVWGTHPSGVQYCWLVDAPPVELVFGEIVWPPDWRGPWMPEPEDAGLAEDRRIVAEHGEPFTRSEKGKLTLNSMYFVARFARAGDVLFEPGEGSFFVYDPAAGLWRTQTPAALKVEFADDLKQYADALPPADRAQIVNARGERFLHGLVGLLQGHVEQRDAFRRRHGIIHVANGMLHLLGSDVELRPFALEYRSRNVAPVAYDPAAECPRFRRELLEDALDPADVSLVQRHAGAVMLGSNRAQKIMVYTGTAGGGKSTLVEILERMVGRENVAEIRTEHLAERFEIARYIGKQMLTGKDVPGRFLEAQGANRLKALVGHDLLDAERKGSNGDFKVVGDYGVVITCNSRLKVRLDGDADAWRRRLLIVKYERPRPERPERDFATRLLATEGPGILRWIVDGARLHLEELDRGGDFELTAQQRQRVNALLAESDSVREFIRQRVERWPGADLSVFELVEAYTGYCEEMGWEPLSARRVENALADAMQELCRVAKNNDILRGEKSRKGFSGVRMVQAEEAGAV